MIQISDIYAPNTDNSDNIYITKSMDPTSHFESATYDVLEIYKKITGKELDLTNLPEDTDE
jgi:Rab GDP dissociation inhibitor